MPVQHDEIKTSKSGLQKWNEELRVSKQIQESRA